MMKLTMTPLNADLKPTVGLEQSDQFLHFHVGILPWTLGCGPTNEVTGAPRCRTRTTSPAPARPVDRRVRRKDANRRSSSSHPDPRRRGMLRGLQLEDWDCNRATSGHDASRRSASDCSIAHMLPSQPSARGFLRGCPKQVAFRRARRSVPRFASQDRVVDGCAVVGDDVL